MRNQTLVMLFVCVHAYRRLVYMEAEFVSCAVAVISRIATDIGADSAEETDEIPAILGVSG
jgi:hypothetical protein